MYTVGKTLCDRSVQQRVGAGGGYTPPVRNVKLKEICVKTLNFRQVS